MIQREELRELMYAKKITAKNLADILGISKQAFYNKLNSNTEFTEREICRLIQIFGEKVWKVTSN